VLTLLLLCPAPPGVLQRAAEEQVRRRLHPRQQRCAWCSLRAVMRQEG
jgi:hypothetical protein